MPAASLLKFHVSQKNATKRCADRRNELGGSSCHAFSENLHPIHTLPEGLKTLLLALCVMCIVRNPREKEFSVKSMGAIASNWFVLIWLAPQLTRQKF